MKRDVSNFSFKGTVFVAKFDKLCRGYLIKPIP